jgi:hypothetical protein
MSGIEEDRVNLIAEQMRHANSLIQARIDALEAELGHTREFNEHRLGQLERQAQDHEARIRSATDGVTQFKLWSGLANGGAGLVSVLALLRSFLGG